MKLIGNLVQIRKPVVEDAEYSFKWFSNPQVTKYLPLAGKGNIPLEDCQKFIQTVMNQDRPEYSVMIDSLDGTPIGCGGFRNFVEGESAEISLVIGEPSYWGQGYAREAITLLINYGFKHFNLKSIWLIVRADNDRGFHLFESLKFETVGVLKNSVVIDGVSKDKLKMELLLDKWQQKS